MNCTRLFYRWKTWSPSTWKHLRNNNDKPFGAAFDKIPERIQKIVDTDPEAEYYCTDGYLGYVDVVCPGRHIRNARDKSYTFTVEGVNADLRYYIPILRRRCRFPRKLETLRAVLELFVQAYNDFQTKSLFKFSWTSFPVSWFPLICYVRPHLSYAKTWQIQFKYAIIIY